jgi:hypothetical protein
MTDHFLVHFHKSTGKFTTHQHDTVALRHAHAIAKRFAPDVDPGDMVFALDILPSGEPELTSLVLHHPSPKQSVAMDEMSDKDAAAFHEHHSANFAGERKAAHDGPAMLQRLDDQNTAPTGSESGKAEPRRSVPME